MSWIQRFLNRDRMEKQLDAELRFHIERLTDDLMREGFSPDEARRQATLRFGGHAQIAEDCRDARGTLRAESLVQDLRYALRVLAKSPAVTMAVVGVIALAIGANTLIFSAVNALLLKPLPYPHEKELFMLFSRIPSEDGIAFSTRELQLWLSRARAFSSFGGFTGNGFTLAGRGEPVATFGILVTPGVFSALGVPAALGRAIDGTDARPGHDRVVVLSDQLWRERFASDPTVIGQTVYLNRESYTVIGVMPPGFRFPGPQYRLWIPATLDAGLFQKFPNAHFLRTVGRLRPGVTPAQLDAEVAVLGKRLAELDPSSQRTVFSVPLSEVTRGPVRRPLLALMGAVGFVLLIACANVASILLARGAARHQEFAVRVALGAPRFRLLQQVVMESTLLAVTGGACGVAIALVGVRLLKALGTTSLPGIETVQVDAPVLEFALSLSIVTGLVFGLAPAAIVARRAISEGLRQGRRSTGERGATTVQRALVATEVALSVILVAGAGLFAHSFLRLYSTSPGFRPEHVLTASVALDERAYPDEQKMLRWERTALEAARAIPGVDAAAVATHMPFSGQGWGNGYEVEGHPAEPGKGYVAQIRPVSPGFFHALGIAFRQGEGFTDHDTAGAPGVAIVNDTLARRFWPDGTAIGKRIRFDEDWLTIRGVVADIKHSRLDAGADPEIYVPYEQLPPNLLKFLGRGLNVIVHGSLDAANMASALRVALRTADPAMAIRELRPLEELISDSFAQARLRTSLIAVFSAIALLLAAIGIYGVMSYLVTQRMQEMGIRFALGASRAAVIRMVVSRALTITALGAAAGLAGAFVLVHAVRGLLFGITEHDPLTFTIAPAVMIAVAVLASLAPALRASRADPLASLRAE